MIIKIYTYVYFRSTISKIRIFLSSLVFLVKTSFRHNLHRPHVSPSFCVPSDTREHTKREIPRCGIWRRRERERGGDRALSEPHSRAGLKFESHGTR